MKTVNALSVDKKLVYNVNEMAATLGIGVPAAHDLCHIDGFPALRVGNRFIIPKQALENWLMENAGTSNA